MDFHRDPKRAQRFIDRFERKYGSIEGLADRMIELIDRAELDGDYRAAFHVFDLLVGLIRMASLDDFALWERRKRQLRNRRGKPEDEYFTEYHAISHIM